MTQNELGTFLRTRREAVTPLDVGLPAGSRRRTPGLRRSELAMLSDISVEYLVRLEQGRDRHPSIQVLSALADALRLTADERVHLRNLVKAGENDFLCPAVQEPGQEVRPTVLALLERLEPAAAVVLNRLSEVLAHTVAYERLAGPVGMLDGRRPSLLRFVFADSRSRAVFPEWDQVADRLVADLRAGSGRADPYVDELARELTEHAGADFTERLAGASMPERSGLEVLAHPEVGELHLAFETLELSPADDQRIVVYLPGDDASSAGLDRLAGRRAGALRVVGS